MQPSCPSTHQSGPAACVAFSCTESILLGRRLAHMRWLSGVSSRSLFRNAIMPWSSLEPSAGTSRCVSIDDTAHGVYVVVKDGRFLLSKAYCAFLQLLFPSTRLYHPTFLPQDSRLDTCTIGREDSRPHLTDSLQMSNPGRPVKHSLDKPMYGFGTPKAGADSSAARKHFVAAAGEFASSTTETPSVT
jgi:hypothetical protein